MTSAPPVPPPSYWPDQGTERPTTSKPPGWAKGILAGAAVVALLGGGLIGVRNLGSEPQPIAGPQIPKPTFDLGSPPSSKPSKDSTPTEEATPQPSSTFPMLKAVPEVCDMLPDSLTKRLSPKSVSEVGVQKDGYGALRKGCGWGQSVAKNILPDGYLGSRSIRLAVNVWPTVADARDDADSPFDTMRDWSGTTEENPGLEHLSTYGKIKDLPGIGDEAHALYTKNQKGTTNVWVFVVMGNATIDIRYFGTDNKDGEILARGDDTRPVAEDVLQKGAEEIAKEVVKNLQG